MFISVRAQPRCNNHNVVLTAEVMKIWDANIEFTHISSFMFLGQKLYDSGVLNNILQIKGNVF